MLLALLLGIGPNANAYSVLSHEEVVDMAWQHYMVPLILQRYPGLTPEQLTDCHSYAYGGSVIQDIGYYPFGDKEFSDLLHYVRSGDFVTALIRDASTPQEYAFALGALAHYYGDTLGHPVVNIVTSQEYPALRSRFGRIVTYGDDKTAHLRTEFGFDIAEVAHGNYSQQNYRDFIGFQVAAPLLNRAFEETYGLPIDDVLKHEDLAICTYRYSVSSLIPHMTKVALINYHDQIAKATPSFDKRKFIYRMRRTEFEKTYGKQRFHASFGTRLLAFFLQIVPKVGPFRALQLHLPDASQQTEYLASINKVEDSYRARLTALDQSPNTLQPLPELDFDTGAATAEGEYSLADKAFAYLVETLANDKSAQLSPSLLADINRYYSDPVAVDRLKDKPKQWAKLQSDLEKLRQRPLSPAQTAVLNPVETPVTAPIR